MAKGFKNEKQKRATKDIITGGPNIIDVIVEALELDVTTAVYSNDASGFMERLQDAGYMIIKRKG